MTTPRIPFDFYETPDWQTKALLRRVPIRDCVVLEPCVGLGAIQRHIHPSNDVVTNDLNPDMPADMHLDAARASSWDTFGSWDWMISNIPFNQALPILQQAVARYAGKSFGGVACILRLTFLEPTKEDGRGLWLADYPPDKIIVLPRHRYRTDLKNTDSVTTAWMVWSQAVRPGVDIVTTRERDALKAEGTP